MSEDTMIRYCSPTFTGIKTGGLFISKYDSIDAMEEDISIMNRRFQGTGVYIRGLSYKDGTSIIYVYRPVMLIKDLRNRKARAILAGCGYKSFDPESCIEHLTERLSDYIEFPHEIGLFLGYPPEDVDGFIKNGARGCKYVGLWKVYGNVEKAKRVFGACERSTRRCYRAWLTGTPIHVLAEKR